MKVNFEKVILQNFMSFGYAELDLNDKGYCLKRSRGSCITVVQNRQKIHQDDGTAGTEQNIGHPLSDAGVCSVGKRTEQRQQKECQNIVGSHDRAGKCLVHVKCVGQNQWDDTVIHLPECADGQKCQPD